MLRGNIDVDPNNWRRISFHRRSHDGLFGSRPSPGQRSPPDLETIRQEKARNKEAMKMFWYPISYTILVGPLSINRWRSSFKPSSNAGVEKLSIVPTSVVLFIFGLSGLCNVLLFLLTRPNLLLFNVRRRLRRERHFQQLSQVASTGVSFAPAPQSYGVASTPAGHGVDESREMPGNGGVDDWDDEGYFEDSPRRSDIDIPNQPNYPPPPPRHAPRPPQSVSPIGSPFSGGIERPDSIGEAHRMTTFGSPRESLRQRSAYDSHQLGAEDCVLRRTSVGSSRYTTATTSIAGTIPAGNDRPQSGASVTRFREHFHEDDVPITGIRTIPPDHYRLSAPQSTTLPVMPEPPSIVRRSEPEEPPLTSLPPPPDPIYSRSGSRIPPSSPTADGMPPAPPPVGYPSPDSSRAKVEEWQVRAAPPHPPPPGPMQ
ncbi:hypothetical protein FRB90_006685 [Tulasnella sp. 427]|nr:hypothetical protein FRB90_006685 [Tulasnella sp. 427]